MIDLFNSLELALSKELSTSRSWNRQACSVSGRKSPSVYWHEDSLAMKAGSVCRKSSSGGGGMEAV